MDRLGLGANVRRVYSAGLAYEFAVRDQNADAYQGAAHSDTRDHEKHQQQGVIQAQQSDANKNDSESNATGLNDRRKLAAQEG